MKIKEDWTYDSRAVIAGTQWTDPKNNCAKLVYQFYLYLGKAMTPHEGIWKDYGSTIIDGGEVEYGVFNSKYMADAYYARYVEDGYVHIALYFLFIPADVWAE
jgi:hypothetical protein